MADADDGRNALPASIQDFIFLRELSEVYLLLDHISGRWDKNFVGLQAKALAKKADIAQAGAVHVGADAEVAAEVVGPDLDPLFAGDWIEEICKISWPPENIQPQRARQAALLLRAKDSLTAAAKPATGLSIAFTLLVTGDDPTIGGGYMPLARRRTMKLRQVPSRMSLAEAAFPGLVRVAFWFKLRVLWLGVWLSATLLFTCFLSWNIASGNALLARLDDLHRQERDVKLQISAVASQVRPAPGKPGSNPAPAGARSDACGASTLPLAPASVSASASADAKALAAEVTPNLTYLCLELQRIGGDYRIASAALSDWLYLWRWTSAAYMSRHARWNGIGVEAPGAKVAVAESSRVDQSLADDAWARNFLPVLLNSVLPFCYGLLGTGTATVRYLGKRAKESLLSPRDVSQAFSQLLLGATIGGCIGLFIGPAGLSNSAGGGLIASSALPVAALAFLAGFGVEGVFVALESLVRRIFNTPDATQKP